MIRSRMFGIKIGLQAKVRPERSGPHELENE